MTDLPPPFPGPLTVERSALRTPDDVDRMLQLHALGWGVKRIARELGCANLHLLVTDGGFRLDGTFASWPAHDTARLTEAFRRAVLRLFVRLELFDEEQAAGMLTWPHSGFHVHTAVWEGPYGCPRTIERSRRASRGTVRGIPSRWNG